MQDRVLISGSSGFIGRALTRSWIQDQQAIVTLYRYKVPLSGPKTFAFCSDLSSVELLKPAFKDVDTVVSLAWKNHLLPSLDKRSVEGRSIKYSSNIQMIKNLIMTMEIQKTRRIIFVSALGATRDAETPFLQEKYHAESLILNSSIPEKIILKPTVICSDDPANDRFLGSMLKSVRLPFFYPVPFADKKVSPILLDDFINIIKQMASNHMDSFKTIVWKVKGRENFQVDDLAKKLLHRYGMTNRIAIKGKLGKQLYKLFENDLKRRNGGYSMNNFLDENGQMLDIEEGSVYLSYTGNRTLSDVVSLEDRKL